MSEKTARDEEVKAATEIITNELVAAGLINTDELEEKMQRLGGQLRTGGRTKTDTKEGRSRSSELWRYGARARPESIQTEPGTLPLPSISPRTGR